MIGSSIKDSVSLNNLTFTDQSLFFSLSQETFILKSRTGCQLMARISAMHILNSDHFSLHVEITVLNWILISACGLS